MCTMPTKRRMWPRCDGVVIRNWTFDQKLLVTVRRLIQQHPGWGRTRISQELCDRLNWLQPNGRRKDRACRVALLHLQNLGFIDLPQRLIESGGKRPYCSGTDIVHPATRLTVMPRKLHAAVVNSKADARTWNSLVSAYHYLGLPRPVGRLVRYLIYGDGDLVGAISFTESAWRLRAREEVLKAIDSQSSEVIGNNRFLVLPHVTVPNLASRVLGHVTRRIVEDWRSRYGTRPQVAETFVDPTRFIGTCYLAANWVVIGQTSGYAKHGSYHTNGQTRKTILLRGLSTAVHKKIVRVIEGRRHDLSP